MEFLGVGLNERFLPPIQISVVDVNNWQKRAEHNELESNQIQVSSLLILTHLEKTSLERQNWVIKNLKKLNPYVKIIKMKDVDVLLLPEIMPSNNTAQKLEHQKAHWASCSINLQDLPSEEIIFKICNSLPKSILRVKGCTKIFGENKYTYFEKKPDGEIKIRPFNGVPITGAKLLCIGPGSTPDILKKAIESTVSSF